MSHVPTRPFIEALHTLQTYATGLLLSSCSSPQECFLRLVCCLVQDAHAPDDKKRKSKARTPLQGRTKPSVTSVVFGDKGTLATGGVYGMTTRVWQLSTLPGYANAGVA